MRVMMKTVLLLGVIAVLGLLAWIRLAPDDPAVWNVPLSAGAASSAGLTAGPCADKIALVPQGARATCLLPGTPAEVLARLDATAQVQPRTRLLAGSAEEGRITWVARSRIMGFPDYITAEASAVPDGTRLDIYSRQRYGSKDMGVNAARLRVWLSAP
jgi:uncharacterized protein (DUF1499 family)